MNKSKWMKFGNIKNDLFMGFVHRLVLKSNKKQIIKALPFGDRIGPRPRAKQ
jgi:hypothetical protein